MKDFNEKIEEIVFQALGTASLCWTETPKGVFDSGQAISIGAKTVNQIKRVFIDMIESKKKKEWCIKKRDYFECDCEANQTLDELISDLKGEKK